MAISQAQAFVQANERTAFIAADVFLRANGCVFYDDPLEMARRLEAAAAPSKKEREATETLAEWLRERVICILVQDFMNTSTASPAKGRTRIRARIYESKGGSIKLLLHAKD